MTYANGRRIRRQKLRTVARDAMRDLGCTCRPTYRVGTIDGVQRVQIFHDDGCPAIVGRIYAIVPKDFGGCGHE